MSQILFTFYLFLISINKLAETSVISCISNLFIFQTSADTIIYRNEKHPVEISTTLTSATYTNFTMLEDVLINREITDNILLFTYLPKYETQAEVLIQKLSIISRETKNKSKIFLLFITLNEPKLNDSEISRLFNGKFDIDSYVYIVQESQYKLQGNILLLKEIYTVGTVLVVRDIEITCTSMNSAPAGNDSLTVADVTVDSTELEYSYKLIKPERRRANFFGTAIRASSVEEFGLPASYVSYNQQKSNESNITIEFTGGHAVEIFQCIQNLLNFTIIAMKSESYIGLSANGSLTGLGQQLARNECDIALTFSYLIPYRVKMLTALYPFFNDEVVVFFKTPPSTAFRNILFSPFKPEVWLAFLTTLVLIWIVAFIICGKNVIQSESPNCATVSIYEKCQNVLFWVIGMLCQQNVSNEIPVSLKFSTRILILSTTLCTFVCLVAYSGSITSFLAIEHSSIHAKEDLEKHGFKFIWNSLTLLLLFGGNQTSKEPATGIIDYNYHTIDDDKFCIEKVMEGGYAFPRSYDLFGSSARDLGYQDQEICSKISAIDLTPNSLDLQLTNGFFLQKYSPYKEYFNQKILILKELGIINRVLELINSRDVISCTKFKEVNHKENPLEFFDVYFAFVILACGICLSIVLLTFEYMSMSSYKKKKYESHGIITVKH